MEEPRTDLIIINEEDWSYIVKKYTEESIHLQNSKLAHDIILKLFSALKLKRSSIIFNSLLFFQKFYLYNLFSKNKINLDNSNLTYAAASSFFLGSKSSEINIKIDIFLKFSYNAGILNRDLGKKNEEMLRFFEFEILKVLNFDITNNLLRYDYFESIFNYIFRNCKIEFKNISTLEKIKNYFFSQIRYSFIFPCILKFGTKTITLSCIIILLKQLFPQKNFAIHELKELSTIKQDIIECHNLFEKFLFLKTNRNNNTNGGNNNGNGINFEIIRTIQTNV